MRLQLTGALAVEGAPHSSRAVSISPGLIRSPTTEHFWSDDPREKAKKNLFFMKVRRRRMRGRERTM